MQKGSLDIDDPPQKSSVHVSQTKSKKGFRRKKGESPFETETNFKINHEKKETSYTNPDAWGRLIGRINTSPIFLEGHLVTSLLDTGSQLSMISRLFCEQHGLEIQPLSKLVGCDAVNGTEIEYEGYVELNFQVPGRNFSEDHLFLVVPPIEYHKEIPAIVGTYVLDRYIEYLKEIGAHVLPTLDSSWQSTYYARLEAMRLKEAHEKEAPLGFAKVTKATVIPAGQRKEIHALTKIKHGGYGVNLIGEVSEKHPLPQGLDLKNSYCNLTPGSAKVNLMLENTTRRNITIPAKAIVCQLNLANQIPKLLLPSSSPEEELIDDDEVGKSQADLDDHDLGLTFQKVRAHQVLLQDLDEDSKQNRDGSHDLKFVPNFTPKQSNEQRDTTESVDCKDNGEWLLEQLDLTGLEEWSKDLQEKAKNMLKRNASIFSKHDLDMGRTNLVKHNIILTDPIPFKERYRTIPPQLFSEVKAHLKEMLDLGAIRHSNSPWASAIVLVRKKDGKLRFCIDLRKLNNRTLKDSYSLPRIEHVLDQLIGSTIFTTLDLKAGYWQVEMVEECKPYTAFTCGPLGFYECETMPFGATNAPATFQRLMDNCLGDLNMNWCIVYLDDIIIFSQDAASHIERLEAVFEKLAKAGLKLKPSKCEFFKKRIKYLGHIVSEEGVSTDPQKVEAVLNWPVPRTVYDVRAFLGFVGYYRRFIKGFSKAALPLRKLLIGLESQGKKSAKQTPVDWGEEEQIAFDTLKSLCCKAPILAYPNYKLPFILHTDSSLEGLGAVLYQVQKGVKRVIAYASRSVNKTEMNYPVHKLEFLALKWAITDKFHDYLYGGNTFDVYTDNNPLTYVLSTAKLDACSHRWVARLANYNFNIHYRSGISNVDADALSRIQWPNVLSDPEMMEFNETIGTQSIKAICNSSRISYGYCETICSGAVSLPSQFVNMSVSPSQSFNWKKEQSQDPELREIIALIKGKKLYSRKIKKGDSNVTKALLRIKGQLKLVKSVLYRKTLLDNSAERKSKMQLILPIHLKQKVLNSCHDQVGHQGIVRTLSLLRERFYWPGMHKQATLYVNKCQKCMKRKAIPDVAPLQPIIVSQPMELVHMDFLSIEPSKGNIENVLVITDHFTRYAQAYPSKTQTAQATAKLLWENFIRHYGFPEKFLSDQGRNFESELISELCKLAQVEKVHTTPYHPMTNGQCERFNSTLCNMLGTLSERDKLDWKAHLSSMTHAYNCTQHPSTTYSPYFLMFGRQPRLPIDFEMGLPVDTLGDNCSKTRYVQKLKQRLNFAFKRAKEMSQKQSQKYKSSYDRKIKGTQLTKDDIVLVKRVAWKGRHKIQNKWEPNEYVVIEQPNLEIPVYKVKSLEDKKIRTLHRNMLLPLGVKFLPEDDSDQDSEEEPECDLSHISRQVPEKISQPSIFNMTPLSQNNLEHEQKVLDSFIDSEKLSKGHDSQQGSMAPPSAYSFDQLIDSQMTLDPQFLVPTDNTVSSDPTQFTQIQDKSNDISLRKPSTEDNSNSLMKTEEFLDFVDELSQEPSSLIDREGTSKQDDTVPSVKVEDDVHLSVVSNTSENDIGSFEGQDISNFKVPKFNGVESIDHSITESQFSSTMPYCEESLVAKLDPEGASQFLSAQPCQKEDTTLSHESADFISDMGTSRDSTKDCSSGTSASKTPTEVTSVKIDSVSDKVSESPVDPDNLQNSESLNFEMSFSLPQREGTSKQDDTVPSDKAEAIKPSEPDTSTIQVRRSTRSTKGKPPLRYGSIISHSAKVHSKFGKWLSTISKKVDTIYDHVFD